MSTIIILLANNFIVLNYLDFYFNVTYYQDYIARLMEFVDPDMFAYSSFFGNGLAVHGQEREMSNFLFITENLNDGGLTKIFIETGWLGTFFIIFHYLIILLISLLGVKKSIINKSDSLFFVSVIPILYIFLFLKAHPVHSDIFIFSSLYYSVGCSIYLLQNKVR